MINANNVVSFPGKGFNGELVSPQSTEELEQYFDTNKKVYIDHVADYYASQIINKLGMHGFAIYEDQFLDDFTFTVEALRATLYRGLDIKHPFHEDMNRMVGLVHAIEEKYFEDEEESD